MKLLLKSDNKTIEFLEGSETINVNDDFVQSVTVVAEAPLTAREQLAVVYEDTVSEDTTHNVGLVKSDEGYYALIPQGVINAGGTWTFQIMRRRYSTDGTKYTETASYKYELTVGEGVKNAEGQVVTTAEIMSLYKVVEKQYIRKDGGTMQAPLVVQNPRFVNETVVASDGIHIGTETSEVHYGKGFIVDKYGETETVYGLPTEGGTLVTEGKARTLAQEEIAKYDFIKIVEELPDEGLPNRIYLVPHEAEKGSNDLFDMWLWVNDAWEFEGTKSAEIDNTLYVKFTDYATESKAGVVRTANYRGVWALPNGLLELVPATDTELKNRAWYKPITGGNLDKAVKVGITTNKETLTDEEKQAVASWIGTQAQNIPNTLVQRYGSGNIAVPLVPTAEVHATSKKYVDDGFVPKPTSTIYGSYIIPYVVSTEGQQGDIGDIIKIEIGNGVNTIARRGVNGTLEVGTPTSALHAANKQYVDDGFVAKPASFTGGARVLSISASGETGTLKYSYAPSSDCIPVANSKGNIKTNTPEADLDCANKKYVVDNKGTKLYKHTISGFVGGTGTIDIFSITLIATSNTKITCASDLDLQYTQYVVTANTAYGKVVNLVQTMTDEITMQFHSRPAGGEVETVVLDASSITDNVEAL